MAGAQQDFSFVGGNVGRHTTMEENRYGAFDDVNCEYVITNPRTPVKWINYLGTLDFGGFVDQTGGILLHANSWVMMAETMLGHGDRAYVYYRQINPAAKNGSIDRFECEPYVYPQNILGDEHPQFGLARNSWLTGTASWMYQAGAQYILGVRPELEGLRIDPCIPAAWDGFSVRRRFRGAVYKIQVENPVYVNQGVCSIRLDSAPFEGTLLPVFDDGAEHVVEVTLG